MTSKIIRTALSAAVILISTTAAFKIFTEEENKYQTAPTVKVIYEYTPIRTEENTEAIEEDLTEPSEIATEITEITEEIPTEISDVEIEEEYIVQFPIDLNTAGFEELVQLPGIGEKLAAAIIAYRDDIGGFANREQLLNIKGIGEGIYNDIFDLLYINGETFIPEAEDTDEANEPSEIEVPTEYDGTILDVNKATAEDFDRLPGVDIELGRRIVALREEIGGFSNILELLYVEGMSDELYISIDEYLMC